MALHQLLSELQLNLFTISELQGFHNFLKLLDINTKCLEVGNYACRKEFQRKYTHLQLEEVQIIHTKFDKLYIKVAQECVDFMVGINKFQLPNITVFEISPYYTQISKQFIDACVFPNLHTLIVKYPLINNSQLHEILTSFHQVKMLKILTASNCHTINDRDLEEMLKQKYDMPFVMLKEI
ncbi:UNKNOWN [Stylonychia lemnae]|uniref:Uncharacterized protein n=1 Tax=Stylonychia lemnae TaxID=5949 RepID=A0A078AIU6_STYLE|nr:UNKNOWN [Stylonychia lemnae]|eukprot:CDW81851.1 UNKNOWN [Stylonychia lemnae]